MRCLVSIILKKNINREYMIQNKWVKRGKLNNDLYLIKQEVRKDIAPLLEEDFQTANFLKYAIMDYRMNSYFMFKQIEERFKPSLILYPASGFDRVPKIAFGKEKVIHTSLEEHEEGGQKYFDQLGDGIKVIADNNSLPFGSSVFDAVLLLDSSFEIACNPKDEFLRVLKKDGIIVLAKNIFQNDENEDRVKYYFETGLFKKIKIATYFEFHNKSDTEFFILKKQDIF